MRLTDAARVAREAGAELGAAWRLLGACGMPTPEADWEWLVMQSVQRDLGAAWAAMTMAEQDHCARAALDAVRAVWTPPDRYGAALRSLK